MIVMVLVVIAIVVVIGYGCDGNGISDVLRGDYGGSGDFVFPVFVVIWW